MRGMKLYYAQLFLNQIWTPLFFGAGGCNAGIVSLSEQSVERSFLSLQVNLRQALPIYWP